VVSVEEIGELLDPDDTPPCVPPPSSLPHTQLPLPDYDEYVSRARSTSAGEIDRSAVDFAWAATALKRGHPVEEVMMELERVSFKAVGLAKHARKRYLRQTVRAAARGTLQ